MPTTIISPGPRSARSLRRDSLTDGDGGAWVKADSVEVRRSGAWADVGPDVYVRRGGVWVKA